MLADLAPRFAAVRARAAAVTDGRTTEALLWRPAPGKWSIAEVMEHLYRVHVTYRPNIESAIAAAPELDGPQPISPSLFALAFSWLAGSRIVIPLPTPPFFEPRDAGPESPARFVESWDTLERLAAEASRHAPRQRVRLPVPVLTFQLGEVFPFLVGHAERHLAQAEGVVRAPGFPG